MSVFVAGASGVIGRPLVRRLLEAGHHATGMTRPDDPGAHPALSSWRRGFREALS